MKICGADAADHGYHRHKIQNELAGFQIVGYRLRSFASEGLSVGIPDSETQHKHGNAINNKENNKRVVADDNSIFSTDIPIRGAAAIVAGEVSSLRIVAARFVFVQLLVETS